MSKKEDERQRKAREEYVELLKMKQGLIEESELIPETGYNEMPKMNAWEKFKNFVYHNKVFILLWGFFGALAIFLTVQLVTREVYDLYVLVISTSPVSELSWRYDDLEEALTMYCPDFDENGYVKVGVNFIDLTLSDSMSEYYSAQWSKFTAEVYLGESQMYIADEGIWQLLHPEGGEGVGEGFFTDLSQSFPEDELFNNVGLHINTTGLHKNARWDTCPDSIGIYLRGEYENLANNQKHADQQRERANIVFQNIIDGNIINPPTEE